ncbi:hypothetical protein H9P43_009023 [Blastocladiella emersonii ATCC 22665]|nr:hypothetical protein H9P43_009023 [Blastocladiella emersonii ATCC 22665]
MRHLLVAAAAVLGLAARGASAQTVVVDNFSSTNPDLNSLSYWRGGSAVTVTAGVGVTLSASSWWAEVIAPATKCTTLQSVTFDYEAPAAGAKVSLEFQMRAAACTGSYASSAYYTYTAAAKSGTATVPVTAFPGAIAARGHAIVWADSAGFKVKNIRIATGGSSTGTTTSAVPTSTGTPGGRCVLSSSTLQCSALNVCPGGQCCSQYGWCGTTSAYCGTGCSSQCDKVAIPNLPVCGGTSPSPTSTATATGTAVSPSPTGTLVPGGRCILPAGSDQCSATQLCPGGQCCSQYGWCGTTADHCGTGCQGQCDKKAVAGLPTCGSSSVTATSTSTRTPTPTSTTPSGAIRTVTPAGVCLLNSNLGTCSATEACPGGVCCGPDGYCGSGPSNCAKSRGCLSQCDGEVYVNIPGCGLTTVAGAAPAYLPTPVADPRTFTPATNLPAPNFELGPNGETLSCGWPGMVAITYDDGPGIATARVLDAFRAAGAKATLYWLGSNMQTLPALVVRAFQEAHHLASHSYSHPDLLTLTLAEVRTEMLKTEDIMYGIVGVKPRFMRPPYGNINAAIYQLIAGELGYNVAIWNSDTSDWEASASVEGIESYYRTWIRNPSQRSWVVLEHDIQDKSGNAAPGILRISRENGFQIVPMYLCVNQRVYK